MEYTLTILRRNHLLNDCAPHNIQFQELTASLLWYSQPQL